MNCMLYPTSLVVKETLFTATRTSTFHKKLPSQPLQSINWTIMRRSRGRRNTWILGDTGQQNLKPHTAMMTGPLEWPEHRTKTLAHAAPLITRWWHSKIPTHHQTRTFVLDDCAEPQWLLHSLTAFYALVIHVYHKMLNGPNLNEIPRKAGLWNKRLTLW